MADIFLSYSQEDRSRAEEIATSLKDAGWDVWWDAHLYAGDRFRREIASQLKAATCVVVLWSNSSIESDWVIDEAEEGKKRGVLVQARIDAVEPPYGFRGIQWADLAANDSLESLKAGIRRYVTPHIPHASKPVLPQAVPPTPVAVQPPPPRNQPLPPKEVDPRARATAASVATLMVLAAVAQTIEAVQGSELSSIFVFPMIVAAIVVYVAVYRRNRHS